MCLVAWEGIPQSEADLDYTLLSHKLNRYGLPTTRRCATNENRTCACQGKYFHHIYLTIHVTKYEELVFFCCYARQDDLLIVEYVQFSNTYVGSYRLEYYLEFLIHGIFHIAMNQKFVICHIEGPVGKL